MSQKQYSIIKGLTRAEYYREYCKKNEEKIVKFQAEYRAKNREYFREAARRWRQNNPDKVRLDRSLKRARKANTRVEKYIRLSRLHNWESRLCGICGEYIEDKFDVDHIIPLTRGGEHSIKNLQLAHPFCNRSKHNRLPNPQLVVS